MRVQSGETSFHFIEEFWPVAVPSNSRKCVTGAIYRFGIFFLPSSPDGTLKFGVRKAFTFSKVCKCRSAAVQGACGAGGAIIAKNGF